jgi:hypothetical protein
MRIAGIALGLVALAAPALAQTQLLVGSKLIIKNPRFGVQRNKLVFLSRDANVATPVSTSESPRCFPNGAGIARLTVSSTAGESFTIDLGSYRCANWTRNPAGTRFKYRDTTGQTCNVVLVKGGVLHKALCVGPQVAFQLGAPQGSVDVVLSTGSAPRRWCTTFNDGAEGCLVKKDGSDGRRLVALNCTSAAAACGSSPSGAFVD